MAHSLAIFETSPPAAGGGGGWTLVQAKHTDGGSGVSNVAATFDSNVTSGNLIVAVVTYGNNSDFFTNTTDSQGTHTEYTGGGAHRSASYSGSIYVTFRVATATGAMTVTGNFTTTLNETSIDIMEFSGNNATPSDAKFNSGEGSSTAPNSGAITPSVDGCLVLGAAITCYHGFNFTKGASFTDASSGTRATTNKSHVEYLEQETAASIAADWSLSSSDEWLACVVSFKP